MIVVGVDGSASARDALEWALAETRLRDETVRVICAWHFSPPAYGALGYIPPVSYESFERAAEEAMNETLAALTHSAKGLRLERAVVNGEAAQVLIEAAKDADLLVVGSRGHGNLAGMLLGSVSHQCALHAECPVVIIRHHRDPATEAA
jgi:nucleotide-binding universal stress UspA family protein